jgi:hypothetical protein
MTKPTTLEQITVAANPHYVVGRCPSCRTWRNVPSTAAPECWVCAGTPEPKLEPVEAAGDEPARRRLGAPRGA